MLNDDQRATLDALLDTLIPADSESPGAEDVGLTDYLLHELQGDLAPYVPLYTTGLAALVQESVERCGAPFEELSPENRSRLLQRLSIGDAASDWQEVDAMQFVSTLAEHAAEGFYTHPAAWQMIGFEVNA